MNWTGGSFARHSRNNGNASLIRRQKEHFAKARTKRQKISRPSLSPLKLSFANYASSHDPFGAGTGRSFNQMSVHRFGEQRQRDAAPEVGRARWPQRAKINPTKKQSLDRQAPLTISRIEHHREADLVEPFFTLKAEVSDGDGLYNDALPEPRRAGSTSDPCRQVDGGTLDEQKARLLSREDWAGTNITAPLKIRYPAVRDRSNIGKRRKLDDGYVSQFAAPVRRSHVSARLNHSAAYGVPGNREPRTSEEPVIQIGGRTVGARARQRNLSHEDTDGQAPISDRVRRLESESTMPTMIAAELQEYRPRVRQMDRALQGATERHTSSNHTQSLLSGSSIPDMVEAGPELRIQPLLYRDHGTDPIDSYSQDEASSRNAEWRARNRGLRRQITPSRSRHSLSEIGPNKTRIGRLSRPPSTLSIMSHRHSDYSRVTPAAGKYKQPYPRDSSLQFRLEPHFLDDVHTPGATSGPPTPIGTEVLYSPGLPQGVYRLSLSPSLGPAGRVGQRPARDSPGAPRSTSANVSNQLESVVPTTDEQAWKQFVFSDVCKDEDEGRS